jgi:hypothetical protein
LIPLGVEGDDFAGLLGLKTIEAGALLADDGGESGLRFGVDLACSVRHQWLAGGPWRSARARGFEDFGVSQIVRGWAWGFTRVCCCRGGGSLCG